MEPIDAMTTERRNEITALILAVFIQQPSKRNPVPYSRMVLAIQHCTNISRMQIDHVLVALCCRLVVNLIGGELFFCGKPELLLDPAALADPVRIDWLYGGGRSATG